MQLRFLSRLRDAAKKRAYLLLPAALILVGFLILGISEASAEVSLTSSLIVKKTSVKENATITITMSVTNTGTEMLPGVKPSPLQASGLGRAVRQAWPKPAVAAIAPGATVNFTLRYKTMLAGDMTLSGNAISPLANSSITSTPLITVISKKKTKGAALTDYAGNVPVNVGDATLQLHFGDETTGSSISGLSVAVATDKKNPWRAVVAAADGHGRYPIQILVLQGPSQTGSGLTNGALGATAAATPVEVAVRRGCDGETLNWNVIPPVETPALPPTPPPPTPVIPEDFSTPLSAAVNAALASARQVAQKALISTVAVSCNDAFRFDAEAITGWPGDTLLATPAEEAFDVLAPRVGSLVNIFGKAQDVLLLVNTARDVLHCGLFPDDELSLKRVTLFPVLPDSLQIVWHQPLSSEPDPSPRYSVAASAFDPFGQPLTTGSLELLSQANLGSGFAQALDSEGSGDVPVPKGEYKWRMRSAGYKPGCGETSVTESGALINATLQKNSIASGTLRANQLTGFLPAGTIFNVTPSFVDADGNPVACSGPPVYQVNNPVGSVVATVDQNGNVTAGSDCGAARVTAWCSGVQTSGVLVSTDCNGTLPPTPPGTFAVSPISLAFTATEGGANPPNQILAIVNMSSNLPNYNITSNAAWVSVSAHGSPGAYNVSVNINGMKAGTYKATIDVTDLNAPANQQSVAVTLKIQAARDTGDLSGTWVGTWTLPTNFAFGPNVCNNLQNKTESGTVTMTLSTSAGSLPSILNVAGSITMSGLEAASVPCGGGEICNSCSWVPFSVTSAPINSMSLWAPLTNQALIFADVNLPPSGPPLYLTYPLNGLTFDGTAANGRLSGTFNNTGTFSVMKQ